MEDIARAIVAGSLQDIADRTNPLTKAEKIFTRYSEGKQRFMVAPVVGGPNRKQRRAQQALARSRK